MARILRVLFSIIPGHGHFFPTLPLAKALIDSGHEVLYATSESYGSTIRGHGFDSVGVGIDYTQGSVEWEDADTTPIEEIMFVTGPPVMLADLSEYLDGGSVDVVLVDPAESGSMVAAEVSGVSWGAVVAGRRTGFMPGFVPFDPGDRAKSFYFTARHTYHEMRASAGLEPVELLPGEYGYDRYFSLCMAPESINGWPLPAQHHTSHPLRPEVHSSDSDDSWIDELPDDAPIVAVSFGTLFGSTDLYTEAVRSVLSTGSRVVVSTSYELEVEEDRLVKTKWVSMDRLLAKADLFVHHAGWGSTVAALATGTPSVAVPIGADQFVNSQSIKNTGAGLIVPRGEVLESLGTTIDEVLGDQLYGLNAQRIKAEIDAMPSAHECVPLVEELAAKGFVFNKPEV